MKATFLRHATPSTRPSPSDPLPLTRSYRRALCAIQLGDIPAALPDLERVVHEDPAHDFHRAEGLLAHAYAHTGQKEKSGGRLPRCRGEIDSL